MNILLFLSRRAVAVAIGATLAGIGCGTAVAQQVENPGDIIVMRNVTPRIAYDHVPKTDDPVLVRGTTFPANTFNPMMATLVSDTDLTNAHGSAGIAPNGLLGGSAGTQAITRVLAGDAAGGAGGSIIRGPIGGGSGGGGGIGGMIAGSVTNALSPVTSALGAIK